MVNPWSSNQLTKTYPISIDVIIFQKFMRIIYSFYPKEWTGRKRFPKMNHFSVWNFVANQVKTSSCLESRNTLKNVILIFAVFCWKLEKKVNTVSSKQLFLENVFWLAESIASLSVIAEEDCTTYIYNVVYVTSKGSDQPAHTGRLIRVFASCLNILWLLSYGLIIIWSFYALEDAECTLIKMPHCWKSPVAAQL